MFHTCISASHAKIYSFGTKIDVNSINASVARFVVLTASAGIMILIFLCFHIACLRCSEMYIIGLDGFDRHEVSVAC